MLNDRGCGRAERAGGCNVRCPACGVSTSEWKPAGRRCEFQFHQPGFALNVTPCMIFCDCLPPAGQRPVFAEGVAIRRRWHCKSDYQILHREAGASAELANAKTIQRPTDNPIIGARQTRSISGGWWGSVPLSNGPAANRGRCSGCFVLPVKGGPRMPDRMANGQTRRTHLWG